MRVAVVRPGRVLGVAVATAVASAVTVLPAAAAPEDLTLASTSSAGIKGDNQNLEPSISADGTRVAFFSYASNLVDGDTNGRADVFVKNLVTGDIVLASATQDGVLGNGFSGYPSLSADGRRVAFGSDSTNLAAGDTDTHTDIYVKDLVTGELLLATVAGNGAKADNASNRPSMSADGGRVAFWSYASNWVEGDTELSADVFVKDLVTGQLTLASADESGTRGNGHSDAVSLSADGTRVAFHSGASNLVTGDNSTHDVFVKDLTTGAVTLASRADDGTKGNDYSGLPDLSADGTRVAFESTSSNLGEGDTDGASDVFVKDLVTGDLALASAAQDGTKGNGASRAPDLSRDGSRVGFSSEATNLVPGDTDVTHDVLVKDLATGAATLVSTADDGTKGNDVSHDPSLSADGAQVAFTSHATNLGEGDTDGTGDVYVKGAAGPAEPPPVEPAPTCAGREATVYVAAGHVVGGPDTGLPYSGELRGTDGPDVIVGTPQADRVLAGAGADVVCTLAGADTASGGPGSDQLLGGAGRDSVSGNGGRDVVNGGYDDDRLTGGSQADRFVGGPGRDTATDFRRSEGDTITSVP